MISNYFVFLLQTPKSSVSIGQSISYILIGYGTINTPYQIISIPTDINVITTSPNVYPSIAPTTFFTSSPTTILPTLLPTMTPTIASPTISDYNSLGYTIFIYTAYILLVIIPIGGIIYRYSQCKKKKYTEARLPMTRSVCEILYNNIYDIYVYNNILIFYCIHIYHNFKYTI